MGARMKKFIGASPSLNRAIARRFPGWRTMTAAQRHNAKADALFEDAKPGARYDAFWDTGDPLSEAEQTRRGELLAVTLGVRKSQAEPGRYCTDWGTKTPLGLYRTVKRIVEEGK